MSPMNSLSTLWHEPLVQAIAWSVATIALYFGAKQLYRCTSVEMAQEIAGTQQLDLAIVDEPFALGSVVLCHHPHPQAPRREGAMRRGATGPADAGSFMADALERAVPEDGPGAARRA